MATASSAISAPASWFGLPILRKRSWYMGSSLGTFGQIDAQHRSTPLPPGSDGVPIGINFYR
jgi:hypothetical protein